VSPSWAFENVEVVIENGNQAEGWQDQPQFLFFWVFKAGSADELTMSLNDMAGSG